MNPYNLQTSVMTLLVAVPLVVSTACVSHDDDAYDPTRDESFLALMGSADGKADSMYVAEGSGDARAVLQVVNSYEFNRLEQEVGLDRRLIANVISHRRGGATANPYDTLAELDETPWTTMAAFRRIFEHVHEFNLVGQTFCQEDRCYDVRTINLDLDGDLTFDVADDGQWWVRSSFSGGTVREARGTDGIDAVETTTYASGDVQPWVVRRADGSLTAVTRVGQEVVPEHGEKLELGHLQLPVAAAYNDEDELFVAAAASDSSGLVRGLVIFRQTPEGWSEEFKQPFESSVGTALNAQFVRGGGGDLALWADIDDAARKFSRHDGDWRESMRLDMSESGFGEHPDDRTVTFHIGTDGAVFIHRATWTFSRKQEVVRVDGNMVTAVIDLPTAARTITPHVDGSFSIVYADGTLGHMRDEDRGPTTAPLGPASPDDIVRTNGEDIFVLQGSTLRMLRLR